MNMDNGKQFTFFALAVLLMVLGASQLGPVRKLCSERTGGSTSEVTEDIDTDPEENGTRVEDFQYLGTKTISGTTQYGSVYNRYFREYWVKQSWSSSTIYRYNEAGAYLGTKNTIRSSIALGTDSHGSLYIGDNSRTFYKFDRNGNQVWSRNYNDGSQARGITCDDRYVYALFNYGPILKLDMNTGAKLGTINPSLRFSNAFSMLYFNNMLIVSDSDHELLVYDMNGRHLRTIDPPYNSGNFGIVWTGRELQACEHNRNTWYRYSAVDLLVYTENAALMVPEGEEDICFAEYRPYVLSVNLTTNEDLSHVAETKVYLDYNTTNATLGYNWSRGQFFKLQDPDHHVNLLRDNCTVADDGKDRIWVNFSVVFNFTFPHERPIDCFTITSSVAEEHTMDRFPYMFTVENDLEFTGTPRFTGQYQGELNKGNWIRGGENITVGNLTVRYARSPGYYPDDRYFDVKIADRTGRTWWDNESSREEVSINIQSRGVTDPEEEFLITIENIPGKGICMSNLTYPLKIDSDAPLPPLNLLCHADSFKGRETRHTDEPEMFVTWDEVEDHASGLLGYYYSHSDSSGTINGSFTNETEVELDKLPEGYSPIYLWCIDNVGNVGEAANSGILVDLTPPVFTNFTPSDGSWQRTSEVVCSVEVLDGEGSGVNGATVEYAVSTGNGQNFDMWIPSGLITVGQKLIPSITHIFSEGEENYIKWRAKDITGNGYVESFPVNVKVDVTPISFAEDLSTHANWYDTREIKSIITVSDEGIGVNLSTLEARISTTGPGVFGEWMRIGPDDITELNQGEYELQFTAIYAEGKDNYVMFRGTDLVGNTISVSNKFNLRVDTSPAYFGDFVPDGDTYSDEQEVECFIQIFDDGSGVDVNTVEYSISKDGSDDEDFGGWKRAQNVVGGNPTQVLMELKFEWGKNNYIRWRAGDKMGTGLNVSPPYRIWINSEPTPLISQPFPDSDLWSHIEITFDARNSSDLDGDNLTFHWSSNVTSNRSIGSGARITRKLTPGKHTVTLYVNDGHGYNVTEKLFITVEEKVKKKEEKDEGVLFSEDGGLSLWAIMAIVVLLLLLILLAVWLVVGKGKKKEEEHAPQPFLPPPAPYSPYSQPYGQGQYLSTTGPGYVQQGFSGAISQGAPPSAYPPMGGYPGYHQVPTGPQNAYFAPETALPPVEITSPGFMLPPFTTDQGIQDFDRLALPPAAIDMPPQITPDTGAPTQDLSTGNIALAPGAVASQAAGSPPLAPPSAESPDGISPLPALDNTPFPPSAGAPQISMPEPGVPSSNEMTMQCHACGLNYAATVIEFPAVVTCPVCQTQGVIASA